MALEHAKKIFLARQENWVLHPCRDRYNQDWLYFQSHQCFVKLRVNTVKLGYNELGYNELGYNEHSVTTNKNIYLVGLSHFYDKFSRL